MANNSNGVDFSSVINQLQQLQQSVNKYQSTVDKKPTDAVPPQYPINFSEPKTFEDLLANPVWFEQLKKKFDESEAGKKLRENNDIEFLLWGEVETRFKSTTLDNIRAQQQQAIVSTAVVDGKGNSYPKKKPQQQPESVGEQ